MKKVKEMTLAKDFVDYTRELMGDALYKVLEDGLHQDPPISIRINPLKASRLGENDIAKSGEQTTEVVGWCHEGRYLPTRPNFTFDPLLHAGLYYVQEASSMFVSHVLSQLVDEPVMMLDLCAAPGGKTIAARSALPEGSILMCNEPMKMRASILAENMEKFGHSDVLVTNNFAKDYKAAGLLFDVILTDVPCSGEGMFRKDEGAIAEWSTQNVEQCAMLQRSIVENIWPCLREGGLLIYSTCTFNAHEDEENVNWIAEQLGAEFVEIETQPEWNITGSLIDNHPVYRFIPGKSRGEGLFVAVLRKHGEGRSALEMLSTNTGKSNKKNRHEARDKQSSGDIKKLKNQWLQGDFIVAEQQDNVFAIPAVWYQFYEKVYSKLHLIHVGVKMGTRKGRDIVPDTSLALSVALKAGAFPRIDVDYYTAINYLRKEAILLPDGTPRGIVLITYRNQPLGFVKNIGNRANNLYTAEWKIKSTYLPKEVTSVSW